MFHQIDYRAEKSIDVRISIEGFCRLVDASHTHSRLHRAFLTVARRKSLAEDHPDVVKGSLHSQSFLLKPVSRPIASPIMYHSSIKRGIKPDLATILRATSSRCRFQRSFISYFRPCQPKCAFASILVNCPPPPPRRCVGVHLTVNCRPGRHAKGTDGVPTVYAPPQHHLDRHSRALLPRYLDTVGKSPRCSSCLAEHRWAWSGFDTKYDTGRMVSRRRGGVVSGRSRF